MNRGTVPRPPSIQWYFKQWLGDNKVQGMEWDAYGMHFHLLNLSIQEEPPGSLPNDTVLIRRWLRSPSDDVWRRVQPQVFSAWTLRGDRWFNPGMVDTFQRRENYSTRGKVRDKYENGTKNTPELAKIVREKEVGFDSKKETKKSKSKIDLSCEDIYNAYPRHVGKGKAVTAIKKTIQKLLDSSSELYSSTDDVVVYLIQRARLFALSPAGQAGKFTPHPATWFNDERYADDESEWSRKGEADGQFERIDAARKQAIANITRMGN